MVQGLELLFFGGLLLDAAVVASASKGLTLGFDLLVSHSIKLLYTPNPLSHQPYHSSNIYQRQRLTSSKSILLLHDDGIELLKGELLVTLSLVENMRIVHHLDDFLIDHSLAEFLAHSLHFLEVYEAGLFGVVEVEDLLQAFFGPCVS